VEAKRLGQTGLVGWRERVGDKAARAVARRSRLDADTVRSVLGLAFLALSLRTAGRMLRRLTQEARHPNKRS
jgi:hypothetical protein